MFIYVVLHTGVRCSLTGEAGIFRSCRWVSKRGGSYLSGRADRERAARERCEEADESCPASPLRENAWEDDRAENCTEKNRQQGFNMTTDTFASKCSLDHVQYTVKNDSDFNGKNLLNG